MDFEKLKLKCPAYSHGECLARITGTDAYGGLTIGLCLKGRCLGLFWSNPKTAVVEKNTLILDDFEAQWLKGYLQNPVCPPEEELVLDTNMRNRFWELLSESAS